MTNVSEFLVRLRQGIPQLGLSMMYPSPGVIERIGCDWDWIWVDAQHGQLGYSDVIAMVRACDLAKRASFIRVPGHEFGPIGLALDTQPTGVIVPCVDTPEQARDIVNAAKFPPMGKRSYGGRRPIDLVGRDYSDSANRDVLLVCQIESPQAIENVDAIAATPGVDALFLGPDDILLRRGHSMTAKRTPDMIKPDMLAVANAARKHKKLAVTVGVGAEMFKLCVEMGFNMIVAGGDVMFLAGGSKQASTDARAFLQQVGSEQLKGSTISSPY
jgi:4-hydroxy-2-oxoheptanedioate aldolase